MPLKVTLLLFMLSFFNVLHGTTVEIESGKIKGLQDTTKDLHVFLGVPYARPPVGELRWRAPEPPEKWKGVRKAKSFAARAMQPFIFSDMVFRSGMSEDCLYLNIWTPELKPETQMPVLVYFHGGGFIAGSGDEGRYDGAAMAKKGIVVVTINYRMGAFGFLAHPELTEESPNQASGNYGMLDQVAALEWVSRNIHSFGGDPSRVTIGGESAGSMSVSMHMVSPLSKDLIAGAIGQSGASIEPTSPPVSLKEAEQQGIEFLEALGLDSIEQAREIPADELLALCEQHEMIRFRCVYDGHFLPHSIIQAYQMGNFARIPLLAGWTSAELPAVAFMGERPMTPEHFISRVKERYPDHADMLLEHYPHDSAKAVEQSATDLRSDDFVVYATWKWLDLHTKKGLPAYQYLFDKHLPPTVGEDFRDYQLLGTPHAADIEYSMGNLHYNEVYAWTQKDHNASDTMVGFLVNFVKSGDPNGEGLPRWSERVDSGIPSVMRIDAQSELIECPNHRRIEAFGSIYD
jgi:para-nitrobenzyl esterase